MKSDDFERYRYGVLTLCQEIHSSVNGSGDPVSDEMLKLHTDWLRERVEKYWVISPIVTTEPYDYTVRALARYAIAEADIYFKRRGIE